VQPGVKVNGDYYPEVLLKEKLLPCIKEISGDNFIFQQDSALARRAHDTIALLRREMPDFISPDQWPPNSPDMNPVDYKIWAVMQERVYEKRVNDVDELCQRLLSVWHSNGQNVIDKAIDQWQCGNRFKVRRKFFNKFLFSNSLFYIAVKKLRKSVNICQLSQK